MLYGEFMMSIFKVIFNTVPKFEEHMNQMLEHKETPAIIKNQSNLVYDYNNSKILPYNLLQAELFSPSREENKDTKIVCVSIVVELAQIILVELRDPKKATSGYLSSVEGQFS